MKSRIPKHYKAKKDPVSTVKVYLSKFVLDELRRVAYAKSKPLSRVIAMAIDNELDQAEPFAYQTELDESIPYVEYQYAVQAKKLYDYLRQFPSGVSRDVLLLYRHDIPMLNKTEILHAIRELLYHGVIEEVVPEYKHVYNPDNKPKVLRVKEIAREAKLKREIVSDDELRKR